MSALPMEAPGGDRPFLTGVVEGFYGRPWRDLDRRAYARLLPRLGLNSYLYCPKADPFLRRQWQRHWPRPRWRELLGLAACFRGAGLHFGVGLSPFALYRRYGDTERRQLRDKIRRLQELRGDLLALLFDDMPGDVPDLAERQAEIVADVRAWSPRTRLLMCPTYYSCDPVLEKHFGAMPADYWSRLGRLLPADVDIFWTGNRVCAERISTADLAPLARAFGRPLTLWDNYPVNDGALRSKHLYLEPLPGREPGLRSRLAGHFCNPMNQAWLSLPALRGLAELHATARPPADWEARELGASLWTRLRRDGALFQREGLDGIAPDRRRALAAEYADLPGPAAAEVAAWLRGEFAFDPACLTD
ncbi:beta-N-acetylglucosaminidase domain-containing protein [Parahaliea mediterranea]|uniref:Beta-N-acetylglucosaminidase domain-containing protein n=1 Tax=Parahaliea mediterranea TaxID=651086 RepID=A0A939IN45_9GAMM|nr:beta-N-acetylglucosaminidase domain-containing protein [Parahaliea mediterranea]MBN7797718.1 beta-N-acetylglucosaminidase domain-containing protein [Parahaliea mediterranea]